MKFHIWTSQEINEDCDLTSYRSSSLSIHFWFLSIRSVRTGSGVRCKKWEKERLNILQHTPENVTTP